MTLMCLSIGKLDPFALRTLAILSAIGLKQVTFHLSQYLSMLNHSFGFLFSLQKIYVVASHKSGLTKAVLIKGHNFLLRHTKNYQRITIKTEP